MAFAEYISICCIR